MINQDHLNKLYQKEQKLYGDKHPTSKKIYQESNHLFARVPMTWMNKWVGGFPLSFVTARGSCITDVDNHTYIDFALGDTGAMCGHSPTELVDAIKNRIETLGGITTMMPTEDSEWVANELSTRFGLCKWSFSLSATDANRWILRLARLVTRRPKILVFSYSYHGSVDESLIVLDDYGRPMQRPGNVAPAVCPTQTSRVVEFNDIDAIKRELAYGDVAAVLMEAAMTNMGIILPSDGFLEELAKICKTTQTLLIIDETHTISLGPGGATKHYNLQPDAITIGKCIGGGIPCGAYGMTQELASRVHLAIADADSDIEDCGGVGGTLAGNALSFAAMRAVLGKVLTPAAFDHMQNLASVFSRHVESLIIKYNLPWCVLQLGARVEYMFSRLPPLNAKEVLQYKNMELENYLHLYCINRGILMTPFHNMVLMAPTTTLEQVEYHGRVLEDAVKSLLDSDEYCCCS